MAVITNSGYLFSLSLGGTNQDALEPHFQDGVGCLAPYVSHLDGMQAAHLRSFHLRSDRGMAIAGQSVYATVQRNAFPVLAPGKTTQLVDIALAIPNMNTPSRIAEQVAHLRYILWPPNALLLFDRHAGGIDLPLEAIRAVELAATPELDRRQAQRLAFMRNCQAGVHQDATAGVKVRTIGPGWPCWNFLDDSDRLGVFMPIGQLCGVMQDQNCCTSARREPLPVWIQNAQTKCSLRLIRSLAKKRYAAFVFAQSSDAQGVVEPTRPENCSSNCCSCLR